MGLSQTFEVIVRLGHGVSFGRLQRAERLMFTHCTLSEAGIFDVDDEAVLRGRCLNSQFEGAVFGSTTVLKVHK